MKRVEGLERFAHLCASPPSYSRMIPNRFGEWVRYKDARAAAKKGWESARDSADLAHRACIERESLEERLIQARTERDKAESDLAALRARIIRAAERLAGDPSE